MRYTEADEKYLNKETTDYLIDKLKEKLSTLDNNSQGDGNVDLSNYYNKEEIDNLIPTVPTNVSAFTNDSGYLTSHQDISGKAETDHTHTLEDITDYVAPTIPTVPTNVSEFTNDAGYLTSHQSLSGYATEEYVTNAISTAIGGAINGSY